MKYLLMYLKVVVIVTFLSFFFGVKVAGIVFLALTFGLLLVILLPTLIVGGIYLLFFIEDKDYKDAGVMTSYLY